MSAGRLSDADREYLRRSCEESGVPVKITDPAVVLRAADTLRSSTPLISQSEGRRAA